ncbi:MAG TPA: T9SS type A sorting domain-containing protein [Flavobacterium sp.]|nr:T9SS type A sorting domain-containing protein [Flavobacterium sp.]
MRKIYFCLLLLISAYVKAQIVPIADPAFKSKLIALGVDQNSDGNIQVTEAATVTSLNLDQSNIASLYGIQAFTSLVSLQCSNNLLTSLDVSGLANLTTLKCQYNYLSTIDLSDVPNLTLLWCNFNQLTSLDLSGNPALVDLECIWNNLTSINLQGCNVLQRLIGYHNQLSSLSFLQGRSTLKKLWLGDNPFSGALNFGTLGLNSLEELIFRYVNGATSMSFNGMSSLKTLEVYESSNLSSLSLSGLVNLEYLACWECDLSALNLSGLSALKVLYCRDNYLTELDLTSQGSLQEVNVMNNPLEQIFMKNGANESIGFGLQPMSTLTYICADDIQIPSVQAVLAASGISGVEVNSYCTFTPGGEFFLIQGNLAFDEESNGCDAGDAALMYGRVKINDGISTKVVAADPEGFYYHAVQAGTYTVAPLFENTGYFTSSPSNAVITFPGTSPAVQSFCILPNGVHPDLEVVIVPLENVVPGMDVHYRLQVRNKGNQTLSGNLVFSYDEDVLDFITAMPAAAAVSGTLTWSYTSLAPYATFITDVTLNANSPVEVPALNSGDELSFSLQSSVVGDATPDDNTFILTQTVVNSMDPNDITCLEGDTVDPSTAGDFVHYLVRFENTGTAPAQNVVIRQTLLSSRFQITSVVPLDGSHPFSTRIQGNTLEFLFDDIQLPFDLSQNKGYVLFKVRTKSTLVAGDSFSNKANIYFDYNAPIVTNTATTTLQTLGASDFDFDRYFTIWPNPTSDILRIEGASEVRSAEVYDLSGRLITTLVNTHDIDVAPLAAGTYLLRVHTEKGVATTRFLKQ